MTEEYISGYLEAISKMKDILTPSVGGTNQFFSINNNPQIDLLNNIRNFLKDNIQYYNTFYNNEQFEERLRTITLLKIKNWEKEFPLLIENWTCDKTITSINGKNGFLLSEYLVNFLLKDFFQGKYVEVFKLLPDWEKWHWGDQMSEEYVFVTNDKIFIMHFGESS
ncbi:MAG: hypothetical protein ACTHJT_16245 [Cytophaga sp.]|uniref:hypothetical protein n=1 Tax=Cytophaga sp. TaxID=29535 RepID=UPI003F7DC051